MATILVMDDEAPIRTLLSTTLQAAGYAVVEASNGREGLWLYRQKPADLVIVDILMPELNGPDTLMALTREFLDVKVIAISGVFRTYLKIVDDLNIHPYKTRHAATARRSMGPNSRAFS